ncbi:MAG: hypothetical protein ACI8V4_003525 [Ilumatobacter sp.]
MDCRLVVAVALDSCATQGDAARIPRRNLHIIGGDLDDLHRFDEDDMAITACTPSDLKAKEPFGLPRQDLVSHALEALANHDELTIITAGRKVQVRDFPVRRPSPIRSQ